MSTYKRSTGNIVFQTLEANSSVSFIGPTANAISVVINGDLSVSGNASLTGNIAGDRIFNGTTSIDIPSPNGNIAMSVGGVSNVVVVSSTGTTFAGAIGFTGNVSAGNVTSNGIVTAAGNVNTSGNVNANGNIIITRDAGVGQPTVRFNDSNTTVAINTVLGAVEWFTNDATPGARVTTATRSIATSVTGDARFEVLTSTSGAAATAKFVVDSAGNVGVANTAPLHTFAVSGNTYTSGTATVIGNVTGGNYITAGLVSATGNITSAANIAGGNLAIVSNVTANNLSASTRLTVGAGGISATGNIDGGNLISQGRISATGNLTTTDIFATTVSASGNITGANVNAGGVVNAASVTAGTTVSAVGNITGGNINTGGRVSATGNITGGNVNGTILSAAGNIVSGGYFVGDGGFLSNVTAVSNLSVSQLANGITNLTIRSTTGPITADVNGTANVLIITDTSLTMAGVVSATGNVVAGNINTAGIVSATGNINGGNVNATFGNFNTVIGAANASNLTTGTVPSDRLSGIYAINISGFSATVSAAAQPNITSVGNMSSLSVVGNTTSGNLITGGQVSASGNVTGNFILGNITFASGYNASKIFNGTSEANIGTANGNANISIGGTSNVVVVANTGITVSGIISATGNITGGNLILSGAIVDSAQLDIQTSAANANIVLTPNGTGNVNIATGLSVTGNIIGNDLISNSVFANRFIQSPYAIVAPQRIINRGTGALTTITTAIASGAAPFLAAVAPNGRFVYVSNGNDATVSQYSIDQTTGALTSITTAIATGTSPRGIAVDPTGRFVYVSNQGANTVSQFSINQTTGALTSITTAIAAGTGPYGVTVDPTGRFVYVSNFTGSTISQYSINQTTGALTSITTDIASGTNPMSLNVDPTGRFLYVPNRTSNTVSQYSINQTTGELTSITTDIAAGSQPRTVAVDPSGRFVYVTNYGPSIANSSVSQYRINQTTGALTSIATINTVGALPVGITVDPAGRYLYVAISNSAQLSQYSINQSTGELTLSSNFSTTVSQPEAIVLDPTGRFLYSTQVANSVVSQFSINSFSTGPIIVAGTVSATGNITGGNVSTTLLTATTISASGNITAGNISGNVSGNGAGLANVTAANIAVATSTANTTFAVALVDQSGSPSAIVRDTNLTYNPATDEMFAGGISGMFAPWAVNVRATTNSTSTITGALTVVGGAGIAGNVYAGAFYGPATGLTSIPGGNVTGTVANATFATSAGSATSATTAGTVTTNAQPNITSVGTLSSLAVTANITGGNLSVSTGTVTVGNIVNANGNGVGNIGSASLYFNTVFAKATSAQYADLAEKFLADQPYEPGTVLIFGGEKEVTISSINGDHRVAGVVSTDPSYLMNSGLIGNYAVELALQGRVPCKVFGPVEKGDLLVSSTDGHARGVKSASAGTIIGKSLENFDGDVGTIEIVVGRD